MKELLHMLWMAALIGGLHAAYVSRDRSRFARMVVDLCKAMQHKTEDVAMRDLLILLDILMAFFIVVDVIVAYAR